MTRAAIYARFSTDKQSETSAEDQVRLCQRHAEREGWTVVGVYPDLAISGTVRDRPGLNSLIGALAGVDIVLAEHTDRISRDQEDIAAIFKLVRHAGARIVTTSQGEIGEIHIGLSGTMSALFLKDLADKTRRGQLGRVAIGRIPGGLSYGYALVPGIDAHGRPDRGRRTIDPDQAAIVRRIFADYAGGRSPKSTVLQLNREGVPSPSGGQWNVSTILGNRRRGTGILNNELYIGRIVYNRQRFEKHPVTRKRVAKPNPREDWVTVEAPELAIVDQAVWDRVHGAFAMMADVPAAMQRRPKRLLSGLVTCGRCGGNYTVVGAERWGCSSRQNGRGCTNGATIATGQLEARVLGALRDKMLAPDAVSEFVREYHRAMEEGRRARLSGRGTLERKLARAQGQIDRLVDAIADGRGTMPELSAKMRGAAAERDRLTQELAEIGAEPVLALHPGIADQYRARVAALASAVRADNPDAGEARDIIRGMLDGIVASPREGGRGVDLSLQGRLAAILSLANDESPAIAGGASQDRMLALVAGTGFEPVTFRL